jgi:response regulator RpfG family c-di-GMP phosphodiesterase
MDKILLVDDDTNLLEACRRQFRKRFEMDIAEGASEGLELMRGAKYAVVVSDMRMPGIDGVQFLSEVRMLYPDTVRIMLTGNADQQTAVAAVNDGQIFRFLTKPCPPEFLGDVLQEALEQFRLFKIEHELLEKTLGGSLRVLIEILTVAAPDAFGRAQATRQNIRVVAQAMKVRETWKWEFAAMLAPLGLLTVPPTTVRKFQGGVPMLQAEKEMLARVPQISHDLLDKIPRMDDVADIILYGNKNFDGSGFPDGDIAGTDIPLGARVLKILTDIAAVEEGRVSTVGAIREIGRNAHRYDPEVLRLVVSALCSESSKIESPCVPIQLGKLRPGQVLGRDICSADGQLLVSAGRHVTDTLVEQLRNFGQLTEIQEPVYVV